jgi:hypothetical protein
MKSGNGSVKNIAPARIAFLYCAGYMMIPAPGRLSGLFHAAIATLQKINSVTLGNFKIDEPFYSSIIGETASDKVFG